MPTETSHEKGPKGGWLPLSDPGFPECPPTPGNYGARLKADLYYFSVSVPTLIGTVTIFRLK